MKMVISHCAVVLPQLCYHILTLRAGSLSVSSCHLNEVPHPSCDECELGGWEEEEVGMGSSNQLE